MDSKWLKEISEDEEIKELAWKHVDLCGNCGSCSGGNSEDLKFMKIMVQIRKKEIAK